MRFCVALAALAYFCDMVDLRDTHNKLMIAFGKILMLVALAMDIKELIQ